MVEHVDVNVSLSIFQAENSNSGTQGGVSMLVDRSYDTLINLSLFTALSPDFREGPLYFLREA